MERSIEASGGDAGGLCPISWRALCGAAVWMSSFYYLWLLVRPLGEHSAIALFSVGAGFIPFLLWSLWDYRAGILFTALTLPFFQAPVIPHFFTQGFGDLFAVVTLCGFVVRFAVVKLDVYKKLFDRAYIPLGLFLFSAVLSSLFIDSLAWSAPQGIRFAIADIAGLSVHIGFMAVLVYYLKVEKRLDAVITAFVLGFAIVSVYNLFGLIEVSTCSGGIDGAGTCANNHRITAGFGSPNSAAAYTVVALPIAAWCFIRLNSNQRLLRRMLLTAIAINVIALLTTESRAGAVGSLAVLGVWAVFSKQRQRLAAIAAICTVAVLTPVAWSLRACACADAPYYLCKIRTWGSILARSGADTPTSVSLGATANQTVQNMSGRNLGSPERLRLLQHSTSLFLENPILGVGVGQMPRYTENGWRAHNTFVTTLVEQGIAGFIGIAAWWIFIFRRTWRGAMREGREFSLSSAVLLALVGIFTVSLFHDQLRTVWNWVVMGIAVEIAMIGLKGLPMKLMTTERQPLLE